MIERYELELNDPEAGCSFTKTEDGDLCVYTDVKNLEEENKKLKDIIKSAEIQAAQPKVESLEDRVKAEDGDYEVVMLEEEGGVLRINRTINEREIDYPHVYAQSMRGFVGYVYEDEQYEYRVSLRPVHGTPIPVGGTGPVYPIAVLFTK